MSSQTEGELPSPAPQLPPTEPASLPADTPAENTRFRAERRPVVFPTKIAKKREKKHEKSSSDERPPKTQPDPKRGEEIEGETVYHTGSYVSVYKTKQKQISLGEDKHLLEKLKYVKSRQMMREKNAASLAAAKKKITEQPATQTSSALSPEGREEKNIVSDRQGDKNVSTETHPVQMRFLRKQKMKKRESVDTRKVAKKNEGHKSPLQSESSSEN
jgi:hypothetical protein